MITYKDCPECGARKIHSSVRLCEVCETWAKAHAEGFRRGAETMREACAEERDQARAEVDVLRGTYCEEPCNIADGHESTRGRCGVCRKCAFQRGAEAMRVACAKVCLDAPSDTHRTDCVTAMLNLPIPEGP